MTLTEQILSQLPGDVLGGLRRADSLWQVVKNSAASGSLEASTHQAASSNWQPLESDTAPAPLVVKESNIALGTVDWDVVVCGGTLGILIGCALAQQGWRVALLERAILRGRKHEWNISRKELEVFNELNLLSEAELEKAIATEYNPARISFLDGPSIWIRDVLNLGVEPVFLLETLKRRFLESGGQLFEKTPFSGVTVHPDGVMVKAGKGFKARLLLDVMGHFSPIVQQARRGHQPDGVCLVVGSCARGFPHNDSGDLLVSFTPVQNQCQYFWEAFPARDGRTTYLFTYMDVHPQRLSLSVLFEEYLRLLPAYQEVELTQLQFQRALFGFFPCYRQSPLQSPWSRILPVGDSSGSQSPLSFGGFGAMVRHLKRLASGIHEALQADTLSQSALSLLQPYQPSLSVTWLFQRAMSVGVEQKVVSDQINQLLSAVFQEMAQLGEPVLKPFLQDVVQFSPLSQTLLRTNFAHPGLVMKIVPHVGVIALADWMRHYLNLGLYSALYPMGKAVEPWVKNLPTVQKYYCHRWIEAWQYGSGGDYSG